MLTNAVGWLDAWPMVHLHVGHSPEPDQVLGPGGFDVPTLIVLALVAVAYASISRSDLKSRRYFFAGVAVTAVAVGSPLDAMAEALASAHMAQHILLVLGAGPLFALASPAVTVGEAAPRGIRKRIGSIRRRLRLTPATTARAMHPAAAWLALALSVWFWHASGPYELALRNEWIHVLEHAMFLGASVFFWTLVIGPIRRRPSRATRVLMVFTMAFQGVILAALMTFARTPWYEAYGETTAFWGLDPLSDQQLAGLIMWIPSGLAYTAVGIALTAPWFAEERRPDQQRPASSKYTTDR